MWRGQRPQIADVISNKRPLLTLSRQVVFYLVSSLTPFSLNGPNAPRTLHTMALETGWIILSWPCRAKNRSRARCVVRLNTNSKWIARGEEVIAVKRQIYTFLTEFPSRAYKGPAKSRPVFS
ncbi:hypothetical protein T4E_10295 [Trichinella pseudospiralis]|uniref:Uncharacterized protein n=1 Tax=Trichinella pseudospiralis TaxID=6337 RepID=A0A0V0YJY7_TRIPS|nr:hypothetical protein T4E_10295 [Trichinella pseudospiralis]